MKFELYETADFYDEMFVSDSTPRAGARLLKERIESLPDGELLARQAAAESLLLQNGITFNVYSDSAATEKIFPFDVIPRIVEAAEWDWIEKGLKQRVYALNLFIDDIYHEQKIVKDKVVPEYLIQSARSFRKECVGLNPPQKVWCHITGTDLVRDRDGQLYVLEDNLRCPSGVSYVLENRRIMKRTFPQVFEASRVRPVDEYPSRLLSTLQSLFPAAIADIFGNKHATTNYGIQYTAKGIGSILGGPAAAWLMATANSWIPVFWSAVACNVIAAGLAVFWLKPRVARVLREETEAPQAKITGDNTAEHVVVAKASD
jgi:uncharacterized circularly permuted ATP-grasp superfamily protein